MPGIKSLHEAAFWGAPMLKTKANSAAKTNLAVTNFSGNSVLELLWAKYNTVFISAVDAGREIGFAEKTTRNMLSEGRFPLPTEKIGAKRMASIFVLADFVSKHSNLPQPNISITPRRQGARTKAERLRAQGRA
jgi:hypothetical protein